MTALSEVALLPLAIQQPDGSGYGIYGQVFNATGAEQGSEFRVNSYTSHDQQDPSVTLDVGSFVVTWESLSGLLQFLRHLRPALQRRRQRGDEAKLIGGSADETLVFDAAQSGVSIDLGDGIDRVDGAIRQMRSRSPMSKK